MQKYWEVQGYYEERDYACDNLGASLVTCAGRGGGCECPGGDVYYVRTKKNGIQLTPQQSLNYRHAIYSTYDKSVSDPTAPVQCTKEVFAGAVGT
jgi:hypothetical protein